MMCNKSDNAITIYLIVLIIAVLVTCILYAYNYGYDMGQIDYANNKIYLCLTHQDDGEFRWQRCERVPKDK